MLKYKLLTNRVNNISIKLDNNIDYLNEINQSQPNEVVNDNNFIDNEIKKFKLIKDVDITLNFFNNGYSNNFTNAGFTNEEITLSNKNYRFSYILIQIFDTRNVSNQNLLHSSYIPIYLFPNKNKSNFIIQPNIKYYEFNNIYLSNSTNLVNNQILYANFKFYNAKTGKVSIFYDRNNSKDNQDIFYFDIKINTNNNTYEFIKSFINPFEYIDEIFVNNINKLDKTENKKPQYPTGTLFDVNGNYLNNS